MPSRHDKNSNQSTHLCGDHVRCKGTSLNREHLGPGDKMRCASGIFFRNLQSEICLITRWSCRFCSYSLISYHDLFFLIENNRKHLPIETCMCYNCMQYYVATLQRKQRRVQYLSISPQECYRSQHHRLLSSIRACLQPLHLENFVEIAGYAKSKIHHQYQNSQRSSI